MLTYRFDIDGLRAYAVLAVTFFHLGFAQVEGGFVGVDIFFVISGFLITSILERRHADKAFSFREFYLGRIRRLMPALFATIICTFIASALVMTPDDFAAFAKSAVGAVLSVSNFIFYFDAGYWDTASELKPLLHTWSLGVEEQFYLLWPILLALIFGPFRAFAGQIFLALTLSSLALSAWFVSVDPSGAFYLAPFRVFEFSLGALIIYVSRTAFWRRVGIFVWFNDFIFVLGISLCTYSVIVFDSGTVFPGVNALLPCVGAALLILSGSSSVKSRLLKISFENVISVWLGRVSYSMYLVHWPIISLYRYETGYELLLTEQLALAATIIFATLTLFYLIEQPLRKRVGERERKPRRNKVIVTSTVSAGIFISAVNIQVMQSDGWTWRLPNLQFTPEQIEAGMNARFDRIGPGCRISELEKQDCATERRIQVLVFGNSHEPDAFNFFHAGYGEDEDLNLMHFGTINRCYLERSNEAWTSTNEECQNRLHTMFDPSFIDSLDVIIYVAKNPFSMNKKEILDIISDIKFRNDNIKVITVGGYIYTKVYCARLINETGKSAACKNAENVAYFASDEANEPLYETAMDITDVFIDRVKLLCPDRKLESCLVQTPDGVPVMYDEHHQSLEFAEYSGLLFAENNPDFFTDLVSEE